MTRKRKPAGTDPPDPQNEEESVSKAISGFGVNAALVEEIRQRYEVDPRSVHERWAELFEGGAARPEPEAAAPPPGRADLIPEIADQHARVLRLIHAYRARGHRVAETDPLGAHPSYCPELDPAHYGLGHVEMERSYIAGDLPGGPLQTLRQILERLRATYCRKVGVEFTHIQDPGRKSWLQKRIEDVQNQSPLTPDDRLRILQKLSAEELFEHFLHTKLMGQK